MRWYLTAILDKVNGLTFQGVFARHRCDNDETADAAEESITGLVSRLERRSAMRGSLAVNVASALSAKQV